MSEWLKNSLTFAISKEQVVSKAYELWYEIREEVINSYMDEFTDRLPLSKQKEFKSIKNMIIAEANQFSMDAYDINELDGIDDSELLEEILESNESFVVSSPEEVDHELLGSVENIVSSETSENMFVKWTDEYKLARDYLFGTEEIQQDFGEALSLLLEEAQKGNVLAIYDIGRIYSDGLGVEKDHGIAHEYYVKALSGFQEVEAQKPWKYTEYRIGKMIAVGLGTEQDYQTAAEGFQLSAEKKYKYAQYSLGALYHRGKGVEQNLVRAFELYLKSANQNFPYADFEVAKMYRDGVGTDQNGTKSGHHFQRAFSGFEVLENTSHDDKIQYRLGWMLQNGIGTEPDLLRAKDYYEKSAKLGNVYSSFALAKIVLKEEKSDPEKLNKAIEFLSAVSNSDDSAPKHIKSSAVYLLGKLFLEGKVMTKNIHQAIRCFEISHEYGNQWASYQLGKLFLQGKENPKNVDRAFFYLTSSAEAGNPFSQYLLGKTYLLGKDVAKDMDQAIKWLTLSAEQGNEYAKLFLDNIDKFKDPSVALVISRLLNHMGKIFEENLIPHRNSNGMKIDSKLLRKLKEKKVAQGHKRNDKDHEMLI